MSKIIGLNVDLERSQRLTSGDEGEGKKPSPLTFPVKPKFLELYCGSKSISNEAERQGFETFTVDVNKRFKPDYIINIFDFDLSKVPFIPDVIWASIPCTWFSVASCWKHWNKDKTPKTIFAEQGIKMVVKTLEIIEYFNPLIWWIENPRGMMRKLEVLEKYRRHTVTYCQYGDTRMKPTDIWTNCENWEPRPMCNPGDQCHTANGTNDLNTPAKRAVIPLELCEEIVRISKNNILLNNRPGKTMFGRPCNQMMAYPLITKPNFNT